MKTRFWSVLLLMIAYTIPMLVGFAVSHNLNVFWGTVAFLVNLFVFQICLEADKSEELVWINAMLVLIFGLIVALMIAIGGSAYLTCLTIVMLIGSIIQCGIF